MTLFFFSLFVISLLLYLLFLPLYNANSVIFTFAITPFDIAKLYPKIWEFIKNTYFPLMFISYTIVFNFLYTTFQKYFELKKVKKLQNTSVEDTLDSNCLNLLIGKDSRSEKIFI